MSHSIQRAETRELLEKLKVRIPDLKWNYWDYGWTVAVSLGKNSVYIAREYRTDRDLREGSWWMPPTDRAVDVVTERLGAA